MCMAISSNQILYIAKRMTIATFAILLFALCLTKTIENNTIMSEYKYSTDATVQMWTSDTTSSWNGSDDCWVR